MTRYLSQAQVAERLGLTRSAVAQAIARAEGAFPAPDVHVGSAPGWDPTRVDEIREFLAARPGRGEGAGRPSRRVRAVAALVDAGFVASDYELVERGERLLLELSSEPYVRWPADDEETTDDEVADARHRDSIARLNAASGVLTALHHAGIGVRPVNGRATEPLETLAAEGGQVEILASDRQSSAPR